MEREVNIGAFFKQRAFAAITAAVPILTLDHGRIQIRIRIIQ